MAEGEEVPYAPQDLKHVDQVIDIFNQHEKGNSRKGKGGFSVKKKTFHVADNSGRTVDSWMLQDWDYKKDNLPTYARGLFTHTVNGNHEIAVRGYDKFFNVGEVNKTQWRNVEQNTRGPYELSVKENGCIIFIAGLDNETLLVTSKHSTGVRGDASANHALNGERWIDKQLALVGKTRADLAKKLREMNATAVAELCDDEFEEHVLQYKPDQAGLYLHGINLNLPNFATYPGNLVAKFADAWGFRQTMYVMENDIETVKTFLEKVAETGNYDGRDTEGFVIRCQARDSKDSPWHDWFFKYKFEEPYLMYRQWREVTKSIISGHVPRYRKHTKITEEYLLYARRQLSRDPQLGKLFNQNHGIIAMRDGFLEEKGVRGSDIIRAEEENGEVKQKDVTHSVVLVPIATIGCGKTTLAKALVKLFDWGHEQNDNISGKGRRPPRFALAVTNTMARYPVVIADRNNHQARERQQLFDDVTPVVPNTKFVALHYVHDRDNYEDIRHSLQERVLSRGDNHQTIRAATQGSEEVRGIMEGFLHRFQPVDTNKDPDSGFDKVINLDPTADSRENLEIVIRALHETYPKLFNMPTGEDMDNAMEFSLGDTFQGEQVDIGFGRASKEAKLAGRNKQKHATQQRNAERENKYSGNGASVHPTSNEPPAQKQLRIEYFSITLDASRIKAIIDAVFTSTNPEAKSFYIQLKESRRIQKEFHVTLIHRASSTDHAEYWQRLNDEWTAKFNTKYPDETSRPRNSSLAGTPADIELGNVKVQLERVVWDGRVMAILTRLVDADKTGYVSINEYAHITVGTAGDGIKPKESNDLLKKWNKAIDHSSGAMDLKVKGNVVLEGKVVGIVSR